MAGTQGSLYYEWEIEVILPDGFSFPCEGESKVPDESESDEVADLKRKEKF